MRLQIERYEPVDPVSTGDDEQRCAEWNALLARKYLQDGDFDRALNTMFKVIDREPHISLFHRDMGDFYFLKNYFWLASACYQRAVDLGGQTRRLFYYLVLSYSRNWKISTAIALLSEFKAKHGLCAEVVACYDEVERQLKATQEGHRGRF